MHTALDTELKSNSIFEPKTIASVLFDKRKRFVVFFVDAPQKL